MDTVKAEKESALRRYRRLRQLGRALRCVEAGAAVLLLTWSSFRLPAAARSSGDVLRGLATALLSPRAVFLVGNAIVLLLFSGKLSPSRSPSSPSPPSTSSSAPASPAAADLYDEFLQSRGRVWYSLPPPPALPAVEEVVYEDKAVCVETRRRGCRRSRSEKMERRLKAAAPELRRAETDVGLKDAAAAAPPEKAAEERRSSEDDEEFRQAVEAFIAKQLRFRREESLAVVSSSAGPPEPIEVKY